MIKLNTFKDYSSENKQINEENQKDKQSKCIQEKILCNHCGRTSSNGVRCLGICVADSDY